MDIPGEALNLNTENFIVWTLKAQFKRFLGSGGSGRRFFEQSTLPGAGSTLANGNGPGRRWVLILILAAFGLGFHKSRSYTQPSLFLPVQSVQQSPGRPVFNSRFVSSGITRMVHAPCVVEVEDGRLRGFWFAGSREGGDDVKIHSAVFSPGKRRWSAENVVQTRRSVQSDLYRYIRRLGNSVAVRGPEGKLWLFFVSTSIGGWSTSSINMTSSLDGGKTWHPVRRLITSPFLNLSTLVKTVPFFYRDGTLGLPIYHELFAKYGEILHLNAQGEVLGKLRLNHRWRTLQPLVLPRSATQAVALMRYSDWQGPRNVIQVVSRDGGRHWSEPVRSMMPNPDSALAGTALEDGRMIVIINNDPVHKDDLTLMVSEDAGRVWKEVFRFEDQRAFRDHRLPFEKYARGIRRSFAKTDSDFEISDPRIEAVGRMMCDLKTCRYRFDYPYLIQSSNGHFHLLYTWNRTYIKHVEFNRRWLEEKIKGSDI